jgi:hypothetical protein
MAQETQETREPDVLDRDDTAAPTPAAQDGLPVDGDGLPILEAPADPEDTADAPAEQPQVLDDDEAASLLEVMLNAPVDDPGPPAAEPPAVNASPDTNPTPPAECDDEAAARLNAILEQPLEATTQDATSPDAPPDGAPQTGPGDTPAQEADNAALTTADADATAAEPGATDAPRDLDAELEALLNEQPIDPEVLDAAGQIAAQDAELAEQNREALQQRAAEAAEALEAASAEPDAPAEDTPGVDAAPPPDAPAAAAVAADTGVPDDQSLVAEIDSLLAAELEAPAQAAAAAEPGPADSPAAEPDPTIDQIDQMLAMEAEDDEELIGEFFSSDDVISGITPGTGEAYNAQSQDDPADEPAPADQAIAAAPAEPATAADGAPAEADAARRFRFDWHRALAVADRVALRVCWLLNWPARRYLSREWRATLGYLALLQVGGAAAVWLLLVIL